MNVLKIIYASAFKRDIKKIKSEKDLAAFKTVVSLLSAEESLPVSCRPHRLIGLYTGYFECHIRADLLLVYEIEGQVLYLYRIGTHAALFK